MPSLLGSAPQPELKRLAGLFPKANLQQQWPDLKGTKEEICSSIADHRDEAAIKRFLDENITCCKQHVYVLDHDGDKAEVPKRIREGENLLQAKDGSSALYLVRAEFKIVLSNPPEAASVNFLWPVRFEISDKYRVVRFVVLEKDLASYVDGSERSYHVDKRSVDELAILDDWKQQLQLRNVDLHKGVKDLWENGFMDAVRVSYKKPLSKVKETMDEEKGIRENDKKLYKLLKGLPLLNAMFIVDPEEDRTVSRFSARPGEGHLAFFSYTKKKGDTDYVVGEIVRRNQ